MGGKIRHRDFQHLRHLVQLLVTDAQRRSIDRALIVVAQQMVVAGAVIGRHRCGQQALGQNHARAQPGSMRGVAALADEAEAIAGSDDPRIGCGAMQRLAKIFEDRRVVRRDGGKIIEGLVDARYQACGRNIVAEDPSIHYLGEEGSLGNELPQEMRNIFLSLGHEGLFIACASSKGNHHCLLAFAHGHGAQRRERRQHGRGGRSGGCAKKFAPAPRDRVLDPFARIPDRGRARAQKPLTSAIVMCAEGVHFVCYLSSRKLVCRLRGLLCLGVSRMSPASSASASSCFICLSIARCSSASCFWWVRLYKRNRR